MFRIFLQKLSQALIVSFLNGMLDEIIALQRSFVNSEVLEDEVEVLADFLNNRSCLLSSADCLCKQFLCFAILQCCCTVKRLSLIHI